MGIFPGTSFQTPFAPQPRDLASSHRAKSSRSADSRVSNTNISGHCALGYGARPSLQQPLSHQASATVQIWGTVLGQAVGSAPAQRVWPVLFFECGLHTPRAGECVAP